MRTYGEVKHGEGGGDKAAGQIAWGCGYDVVCACKERQEVFLNWKNEDRK